MSKTIKIKNPPIPQAEETFLTAKYTTGTALTVKSNQGWANDDIIVIGTPGKERCEAKDVTTLTNDTVINISAALKFAHAVDSPLFRSKYDQVSLERQASGSGAFAEIAEGKQNIEWDERDGFTYIDVAAGSDSDNYRWRFYNSASGTYSGYSATLPGTGLLDTQAGYLISIVRGFQKIPGLASVSDWWLLQSFNRCQKHIDTLAPDGRWWFALTEDDDTTRVQSVANTYKYGLPTYFRALDAILILDENSRKFPIKYIPRIEFDNFKIDNTDTSTHNNNVRGYTFLPPDASNSVGYFGVHSTPEDNALYFYRRYWRFLPNLTNFASTTLIPLPEILINFAIFELYKLKEDKDNATFYYGFVKEGIDMLRRLQRKQIGESQILYWRGQTGFANMFGNPQPQSLDTQRELYW